MNKEIRRIDVILCRIGNFRSIEDHFPFIGMTIPINIFYSLILRKYLNMRHIQIENFAQCPKIANLA